VKFISIFVLILTMLMPANVVFAASSFEQAYVDQIIENVTSADSIEFGVHFFGATTEEPRGSINYDYKQKHSLTSDLNVKIEDMQSDDTVIAANGDYTINIDGEYTDNAGSAVLTQERVYFNDNSKSEWYFMDLEESDEDDRIVDEIENVIPNFSYDSIKITERRTGITSSEGVTFDHYSFEVDPAELAKMLQDSNELSESDVIDMENYLNSNVTQHGSIWINTDDMLPHVISMSAIVNDPENDLYGSVGFTINFISFNEDLNISEPTNAIDFVEHVESLYSDDDGDGLVNIQEERYGSDPNNPDSDGDGHSDGVEVRNGYNPISSGQLDTDGDSIGDHDEMFIWHTNRYLADSDRDGYTDDIEIKYLYNPMGSGQLDTDNDGVSDHDEMFIWNTDRFNSDSDNDGYSDGIEIHNGYNPNGSGRI
jgi:hypothetical protein